MCPAVNGAARAVCGQRHIIKVWPVRINKPDGNSMWFSSLWAAYDDGTSEEIADSMFSTQGMDVGDSDRTSLGYTWYSKSIDLWKKFLAIPDHARFSIWGYDEPRGDDVAAWIDRASSLTPIQTAWMEQTESGRAALKVRRDLEDRYGGVRV